MAGGLTAVLVKQLAARDDPDKIVFLTSLMLTPLSLFPALYTWSWPTLDVLPILLGIGVCAVTGHVALVRGYTLLDASLAQTSSSRACRSPLPWALPPSRDHRSLDLDRRRGHFRRRRLHHQPRSPPAPAGPAGKAVSILALSSRPERKARRAGTQGQKINVESCPACPSSAMTKIGAPLTPAPPCRGS